MRKVAVLGLGYVGLPLAIELAKKYAVVGFDINSKRVDELKRGFDRTKEVDEKELLATSLKLSFNRDDLKVSDFYIVTVPTPVSDAKIPDLEPLRKATLTVSKVLKKGDIVVYESTVYPGCTEEYCVPILEAESGLKFNQDFFCGYSPERINPGDKERTITKIKKVTSGSTPEAATIVDNLYAGIITAGTFKASSIKVAEAAKVIENSQRDINIAFINELALIFSKMNLDTKEVLEAAATKWNFLGFTPGLVGGHCIGVDPYYLTHKAESLGYHPEVILAGRRINDSMGIHVASQVIKLMIKKGVAIDESKVLVMGITFKENCPDVRNSRVIDVISELSSFGCCVDVYDPHAIAEEVEHEYAIKPVSSSVINKMTEYNAVVLAVSHKEFLSLPWETIDREKTVVYDVKGLLPKNLVDGRL